MMYRKPADICALTPEAEQITRPDAIARFITAEQRQIEARVARAGGQLRLATWDDAKAIQDLHARCWPVSHATLEEPSVLWRILSFGFTPLIETPEGRLLACNLNESYDDAPRTSYGVRVTVDPAAAGHNFGAELARYSALVGMARGSLVRRGSVGVTNYTSAANTLNHVGFVADAFFRDMPIHADRFALALPLTPGGLLNNRIDVAKIRGFLATHKAHLDYALVPGPNIEGIADLYARTPFRVVALLKASLVALEPTYLALPQDCLGFPVDTP